MYGLERNQKQDPIFLFIYFISNVVLMPVYGQEGGGVTYHSEIMWEIETTVQVVWFCI